MLPLLRQMHDAADERQGTDMARGSRQQEERHNSRKCAYRSGMWSPGFGLLGSGSTLRTLSSGVAILFCSSVLLALSRLEGRCFGVNGPTEVPKPQRLRGEGF